MSLRLSHRRFILGIAFACITTIAGALDPDRMPSQYVHQQWIVGSSFPGGAINAIAQTPDGYLWIGTEKGLVRFDGFTFSFVSFTPVASASDTPILQLLTDPGGQLWIRPEGSDVVHQSNGHFESVQYGARVQTSQITAMSKDISGRIIVSDIAKGTFRFEGDKAEQLADPAVLPNEASPPILSMALGADRRLWMGTLGVGLFLFDRGQATRVDAGLPDRKINCLLLISQDELWVGTDTGLFRWQGKEFHRVDLPPALGKVQVVSMLRDRDSNIWAGTTGGLLRINRKGASLSTEEAIRGHGGINALFEDREGNIWVGGSQGLCRIRDSTFLTYSPAIDSRFERDGPVDSDRDGRIWFAPAEGGLYALKDGSIQFLQSGIPTNDVVYSIYGDGGDLWVGRQHGGLTRLQARGGIVTNRTFTQAKGLAQNSVYTVYRSRDGSVWAGTLSGGVSRFKDEQFTNYTTANGLASNSILSILESHTGEMWFGTPSGLSQLANGQWKSYTTHDGLPSEHVNCLFEDSSGALWIGTSGGLAVSVANHFQVPGMIPAALRDPIFGIAEDKRGWLWIATSNHVLQVRRNKLAMGTLGTSDVREYGTADGLLSAEGIDRSRSVVADSEGRIWFSLGRGISVVDPSHMPDTSPPAIAHVEGVVADDHLINIAGPVQVPASPKRIVFSFTALSLASPERVRFRYLVDGFDQNWSAPVATREAVYTNLAPGSYRFRVIASNSNGLWNGAESTIAFEVEPAVWQTWWFRVSLMVLAAGLTLLFYRLRLLQLTHQLNLRFEERLAERTRIARELHDTLLQSFNALLLRLQTVSNVLPMQPEEAQRRIDLALEQASGAISEGRDTLNELRSSGSVTIDLDQAISKFARELLSASPTEPVPEIHVQVEGSPLPMNPIVRDEVFRIVTEAVRNAVRHAKARQIEVEIRYDEHHLRLRIGDNGMGIDPTILNRDHKAGHWGLRGMRERAKLVGGTLEVWSQLNVGTEIALSIPATSVYVKAPYARWSVFPRFRNR